jgi:hypothetical protein
MTHDELVAVLNDYDIGLSNGMVHKDLVFATAKALRAVVGLHKPSPIPDWVPSKEELMCWCAHVYPCPTIQVIEKELQ